MVIRLKKKFMSILIFLFLYTVVSEKFGLYYYNSNDIESERKTALVVSSEDVKTVELIKIGWEFVNEETKINDIVTEVYSKVYLIVDGYEKSKIYLGSFKGEAFEIQDPKKYILPQDGFLTCEIFSNGECNDFSITRDEENIIVKKRTIGEKNKYSELDEYGFKIVRKIHFDNSFILMKKKK